MTWMSRRDRDRREGRYPSVHEQADRNTIIIQAAVHGPHNGFLQGEGKGVSREGEGRSNLVARSRINSARIEGSKSACSPLNIPKKSWRHPASGRGDHRVISFHFSGGGTNSWRLNSGKGLSSLRIPKSCVSMFKKEILFQLVRKYCSVLVEQ